MALNRLLPSTLKFRLSSLVVMLVLGATVTVTVVALILAERDMKSVIGNQQYALLSGAAAHIDEHLAGKKTMLAVLAESLPDEVLAEPRLLHQYLESTPTARNEFSGIDVYTRGGAPFDSYAAVVTGKPERPQPPQRPGSVKGQPYFDQTVANRHGMVSAPFISAATGAPTVLITAPIFNDSGELVMVMAGGINLRSYIPFEAVSAVKPGSTGFTFIMTGDGILLSHPDKSRILQSINARPGRNAATQMALRGFQGWTEAENKSGVKGIYSYRRLEQTGWIVGARFPSDEALAPLRQLRYDAAAAATVFAALAGLLAWFGMERLLEPLLRLRRHIAAIRTGGAGINVLQLNREDEIGELSTAFYELIAEREQAQALTRESDRRARTIADNLPLLIAYVDHEKRFRFTNQHYQTQWNLDPAGMLGKTVREVFGPTSDSWHGDLDRALNGRRIHYERETPHQGGSVHFMVDLVPDIDTDGKVRGSYLMAMDITERKNAELRQAASEQRAEAASRAKSEFVANMSHEIRTPMNAVLGIAYLLGNTGLNDPQKKYLDMILASGNALLGILNDVLDFSKIEAGRMELAPVPFQLNDVLNAIATVMTLNAGDKNIELAIGVDPGVPQALVGDAMRLQQILTNLVGNAVKFTSHGEVSLLVEHGGVLADGSVMLRFVLRDTGIGMSAEQQQRVFSAFSQADASTTRRFGGTGLGLAICRRLVALMGGGITLRSTLGQGSEFVATVPLAVSLASGCGAASAVFAVSAACALPSAGAAAKAMAPLRLIVIDDNDTSREYLCKTIRSWNWLADSAPSGPEAVELLHRQMGAGVRYDAVLCDWQMPGLDGIATMQALRTLFPPALQPHPLPVVLMVAAHRRGAMLQVDGADAADAVLTKPATASGLFNALQDALRHVGVDFPAGGGTHSAAAQRLDGVRLLLVEDHRLNQIVARGMLEFAGATVQVAENGQLALDLLRVRPDDYDLVLMDVQMPVMDGFEATRAIRAELGLRLPVLAMTAGVLQSERERCLQAGMDDFIAKPVDVDQMLKIIARHVPARAA